MEWNYVAGLHGLSAVVFLKGFLVQQAVTHPKTKQDTDQRDYIYGQSKQKIVRPPLRGTPCSPSDEPG